jgi:hypothetical protein
MEKLIPQPDKATTIDQVIDQLDDIIAQCVVDNSYLCLFAFVYRETTREVRKAIEQERFENPARMENLDVVFANLYIDAYYGYMNNKTVSQSWRIAFDRKNNRLSAIQHVLLGMNAHINYDLAIASSMVSGNDEIIKLKNDFITINKILQELIDRIQARLGRISILMKLLDFFGFRHDEKIINFSIRKARDFAWLNALELALLDPDEKKFRISQIDVRVTELGKMVIAPPGRFLKAILKLIALFETRRPAKMVEKLQRIM